MLRRPKARTAAAAADIIVILYIQGLARNAPLEGCMRSELVCLCITAVEGGAGMEGRREGGGYSVVVVVVREGGRQ